MSHASRARTNQPFDAVTLEILWRRTISAVDEAAKALRRTSFSTLVNESNDFACVLTDAAGQSLAQNTESIPSFIGTLPVTVKEFITPKEPTMHFFAQADKETNQHTAPCRACGWGKTMLEALSECVRAISDAGWGQFVRIIGEKADRYGRRVHQVSRWLASSKTCSTAGCRHVLAELPLQVRHWTCPSCGTIHDRDYNAAKVILAAGRAERRNACGASVSPPTTWEVRGDEAGSTPTAA